MTKTQAKKVVKKYNSIPFKSLSKEEKAKVLDALDVLTVEEQPNRTTFKNRERAKRMLEEQC